MKEAMLYVIDFLRQVTKMGDEANSYRQSLCENMIKYSAVELKSTQFVQNGVSHNQRIFYHQSWMRI